MLSSLREALSRNGRNGLDNGTVFAGAIRELDITLNDRPSKAQTRNVGCRNLFHASGRDSDPQTRTNESHDCQPLWGFLYDARSKAVFFAERDRLFIGEGSR